LIAITRQPIEVQAVIDAVAAPGNGGAVVFLGTVRDNSEGKRVLYLEYDAYPEMAEKKLAEIAAEIKEKWGEVNMAVVHRIGRLEIGEIAVVIAAGAAHRSAAFRACEYAIDRIKQIVPIWKKEFYQDGSAWIGH
jgi:molybdopterin synthase catalytic subunit